MRRSIYLKSTIFSAAAVAIAAFAAPAQAAGVGACLITKTDTNPFFVKMKEGALAKSKELGVDLKTYAGKIDGDSESQVAAIETCIADGAKGILLTASDTAGIVSSVKQARDAGLLVIALDTPLDPADAADATFATDNLLAGELIGKWAAGTLGDKAKDAKIAFLDLTPSQPTVDVLRDQGFMKGFGIDVVDINKIGDEKDPRIVGHDVTNGNEEGGRKAMENLLQKDSGITCRSYDQRACCCRCLRSAEGIRQGKGCPHRVGRWRLPRRQERRGRRDRRNVAAVSAADGVARHRGDQEVRR